MSLRGASGTRVNNVVGTCHYIISPLRPFRKKASMFLKLPLIECCVLYNLHCPHLASTKWWSRQGLLLNLGRD